MVKYYTNALVDSSASHSYIEEKVLPSTILVTMGQGYWCSLPMVINSSPLRLALF